MKTYLFIILTLLSLNTYPQNKIRFLSSVESGLENFNAYGGLVQGYYKSPNMIFLNLDVGLKYGGFIVKGSSKTYFGDMKEGSFSAYFVDYWFESSYSFKKFTIEYKHRCLHPICGPNLQRYSTAMDRISIKFTISE